ncbi:type II toxin-antitoxin system VapC family toxin [Enterobacter sp.]|uniref:type II toxin-antitoxin system VapC family toxin n=1 Tax=Enterobacter sp. TaxID=42895 RepID=UPI003D10A7A2
MRLLLDTHAWLWWLGDASRLSVVAREAIAEKSNEVLISAVSAYEVAYKYRRGQLKDAYEAVTRFAEMAVANDFRHLPIDYRHSLAAGRYEHDHRDPFDRLLAAQAEIEALALVTCDPAFAQFGVDTLW